VNLNTEVPTTTTTSTGVPLASAPTAGRFTSKHARTPHPDLKRMLVKVPQVTLAFWVIKVLATTVGETAADFLATQFGLSLLSLCGIMGTGLAVVLVFQFRAKQYVPGLYWLAVVLISVVGTLITDVLVDDHGVSLWTCTIGFGAAMLATFAFWYHREGTLSIHSIDTTPREAYYWLAILFTFALGTAAGDLLAEGLNIGYFNSVLMFMAMIGVVAIGWKYLNLNAVAAFWMVYVLTRPLGASTGDFLSQDKVDGGLELGTTITSLVFLSAILAVVVYMTLNERRRALAAPEYAVA
jgi:uncharacterized membrane-anchored protein